MRVGWVRIGDFRPISRSRPMAVNIAESDEEKACKELIRCSD